MGGLANQVISAAPRGRGGRGHGSAIIQGLTLKSRGKTLAGCPRMTKSRELSLRRLASRSSRHCSRNLGTAAGVRGYCTVRAHNALPQKHTHVRRRAHAHTWAHLHACTHTRAHYSTHQQALGTNHIQKSQTNCMQRPAGHSTGYVKHRGRSVALHHASITAYALIPHTYS